MSEIKHYLEIDNGDALILRRVEHEEGITYVKKFFHLKSSKTYKVQNYIYADDKNKLWFNSYDLEHLTPITGIHYNSLLDPIQKEYDKLMMK